VADDVVALRAAGHALVLTHGNGPQVGALALQAPALSLDVLTAMTQGQIGYLLETAIGVRAPTATLLTRVLVDPADPAFDEPTKPVGPFYDGAEARQLAVERGWTVADDSGRGWRRVVTSPRPLEVLGAENVRTLLEAGELYLATHYIQAQRYRALLRREFLDAFKRVDVFVCPTLPFTATRVRETKVIIEEGVEEEMLSAIMQFTGVPSLTGLPSLNVPCGFDPDGLPIGMQVIGRPFAEATLFRVGAAYQSATEFHTRAPKV
jgi:Asp-tRNA(Asn)/Glu-tRNA(Gln) amidotransferase A subunit family amidase